MGGTRPARAEPPGALPVGEIIGERYAIDGVLGSGGMGVVHSAKHLTLEHPVAIKVLRPDFATDSRVVQRFLREARATIALKSEHVARVMDLGTLAGGRPITADPPSPLPRAFSDGLRAVVDWCLAKDPAARFATAGQLADALAPFASGGGARVAAKMHEREKPSARKVEREDEALAQTVLAMTTRASEPAQAKVAPAAVDRIPDARVKRTGPSLTEFTPCEKGVYFNALRKAVERLWGRSGLDAAAAQLSQEARDAIFRDIPAGEWVPERHMIAFNLAVWSGPVNRQRALYQQALDITMGLSFGVIRRAIVQLASPRALLERAPRLWIDDHTHGDVELESLGSHDAVLLLRNHPFVDLPQGRAAISYVLVACIAQCQARNVTESHRLDSSGALRVRFGWE